MNYKLFLYFCYPIFFNFFVPFYPSQAQIVPDRSLPQNSKLKVQGNTTIIEGGTQLKNNLFHSFQKFSIPTGSTAFFNNSLEVQNIFSRVTGTSISDIDGLIRNNGQANLFIINPNGIIFRHNASLDIGGSFLGSTANSIKFSDGVEFSANNNYSSLLLTISRPIGLIFTDNFGGIKVQNQGHNINRIANRNFDFVTPIDSGRFSGLQVNSGNSLALIGGNILFEGGILSSKNGAIEIASVRNGYIGFKQNENNFTFNYSFTNNFNEIQLTNNSLLFVNSTKGSGNTINIQGETVKVLGGSLIFAQNHGFKSGSVNINTQILDIEGASNLALSAIYTSNFGFTPGENIKIAAKQINIQGGQIATTTFTNASSGLIQINSDLSQILGDIPSYANPDGFGGINTFSYGSGKGGDIIANINNISIGLDGIINTSSLRSGRAGDVLINANNLVLKDGGASLGSSTFRNGEGGNVFIKSQYVDISGQSPSLRSSSINSLTFGSGNAGNVELETSKLIIRDGGGITSSTLSAGNAGNIKINSTNLINVLGVSSNLKTPSFIESSTFPLIDENLKALFYRQPPSLIGQAGNVFIDTPTLNIINGGLVSVRNEGLNNAGSIEVTANKINIINKGEINATTAIGQGGNIFLNSKMLFLNNGIISATAGQQGTSGNGGNIRINADVIAGFNNSHITADAFEGRGGNIRINTQGLFFSPDSIVTATSERGINGTVEINASHTQPDPTKAPPKLSSPNPEITNVCQGRIDPNATPNQFVITGTSGIPQGFENIPNSNLTWQDNSITDGFTSEQESLKLPPSLENAKITSAQGWQFNADGTVTLTEIPNTTNAQASSSNNSCSTEPSATDFKNNHGTQG
ncbi:filamentous hemagglutinin-like protein (plasmid) [Nostoc sp. HK-01]|nr:filamentous hemagglutinin-like protein [Nostoc sp. HK-01]